MKASFITCLRFWLRRDAVKALESAISHAATEAEALYFFRLAKPVAAFVYIERLR